MRSRWDMQAHPPDILITNYSMLNIVLLRAVDQGLIDQTRGWLAADRARHVFHVVVDELHIYRGTTGTEVAYLLRRLLHLLGLEPDSPQVRFIGSSASLGDPAVGRRFVSDFFGADPDSFDIHEGEQRPLRAPDSNLAAHSRRLASWGRRDTVPSTGEAAELLRESNVEDVLIRAAAGQTIAD